MKAIAFDPEDGCPGSCPAYTSVAFIDGDGDPSDKCLNSKLTRRGEIPGPDCPLPDVPELTLTDDEKERHDSGFIIPARCVALVEKLRGGK